MLAHEFRQALLGVPDEEAVDEGGHRLRLGGDRAARDHQRVLRPPVVTPDRDPAELEHVEDVREGEFVLEREAHDVERGERAARLEADERQPVLAQLRLHVRPGTEDPLEGQVRLVVDHLVEDLGAEVAHPDVVDIGEGERHPRRDPRVRLLDHLEALAAAVAGRTLHLVEEGGVGVAGFGHGRGGVGDSTGKH